MAEPQKKKQEQKNTDAWKLKQEEKKKKKQIDISNLKESNDQNVKDNTNANIKKEVKKQKKEKTLAKNEQQKEIKHQKSEDNQNMKVVTLHPLLKIETFLNEKEMLSTVAYQRQLIKRQMDQFINKQDTIIHLSDLEWNCNCDQIHLHQFNNVTNSQLICKYADVSYFIESVVTKIFCEAKYIFGNGSALVKKGCLNIILLARQANIPIICYTGTWNYNGWLPTSETAIQKKYGQKILDEYDWVESKLMSSIILEIGTTSAKQLPSQLILRYKGINVSQIDW